MNTNVRKKEFTIAQFDAAKFKRYTQGYDQVRPVIIASFIEQTPLILAELDQALTERVERRTAQLAHKLKSSCTLFCTDELHRDLSEMEHNTINIQTPEFLSFGRKVIMRIDKLMHELQQLDTIA